MMTSTSYVVALLLYLCAALLGAALLHRIGFSRLGMTTGHAISGLFAGLLLAPSYVSPDTSTLAPALITATFNLLFVGGFESARMALFMLAAGAVTGTAMGIARARFTARSFRAH